MSADETDELRQKIDQLEEAYRNVVLFFNSNLSYYDATEIGRSILYYGIYYRIDPKLVVAVIAVESRFNPNAVSPKGAQGLGQLMPGTAKSLGVLDAFDPVQNIYGTVKYLHLQRNRWAQINPYYLLDYILAAYNAGPEAVEKYGGVPPYTETQNYVKKVKEWYDYFKQ